MLRFTLILSLLVLLYSCSEDQNDLFTIIDEPNGSELEARADIFIRVVDEDNQPIPDVALNLAGMAGTTNAIGHFFYANQLLALDGLELIAEANGYIRTQTRVYAAPGGVATYELLLLDKGDAGSHSAQDNIFITTPESASSRLFIQANSLETLDGQAYTGNVHAFIRYLEPNDANFTRLQPAGMQAVALDGSSGQLASFGMLYFEVLGENGEALQSNESISFGIEAGNDPSLQPEEIELWKLESGDVAWQEIPILASTEGRTYYFGLPPGCCFGQLQGWINCDKFFPSEAAIFKVTDLDSVPFRQVVAQVISSNLGQVFNALTNNLGEAALEVPLDEDFLLRFQTACGELIAEFPIAAADLATYNQLQTAIPNPDDWWQVTFSGEDCNQMALNNGFVLNSSSTGYYNLSQFGAGGTVDVLIPKCNDPLGFTATGYLDAAFLQGGAAVNVMQPGLQENITLPVCP